MDNKIYLYDAQKRFEQLLAKDNTYETDVERKSLFWILANNDDLYKKVNYIYDFEDHSIKPECLGYTEEQLEENRQMGEEWMERCTICELPLDKEEKYECSFCKRLPDFSSSSRRLIELGFNLYNGFKTDSTDILNVFSPLDDSKFEVAIQAIEIRFNRVDYDGCK